MSFRETRRHQMYRETIRDGTACSPKPQALDNKLLYTPPHSPLKKRKSLKEHKATQKERKQKSFTD